MSNFFDQDQDQSVETPAPTQQEAKKKPAITPFRFFFAILAIAAVGAAIDPRLAKAPVSNGTHTAAATTAIVRTY